MNRKHVMKVILVDKVLHVILFSWMIEIYVKLNTGYLLWQDKYSKEQGVADTSFTEPLSPIYTHGVSFHLAYPGFLSQSAAAFFSAGGQVDKLPQVSQLSLQRAKCGAALALVSNSSR